MRIPLLSKSVGSHIALDQMTCRWRLACSSISKSPACEFFESVYLFSNPLG